MHEMIVREVPRRKSTLRLHIVVWSSLVLVVCTVAAMSDPYMTRCRKSEEALQLNKVGKNARIYFSAKGTFPNGRSQTLPTWSCCPGGCGVVPARVWAADPIWAALDFSLDEASQVHYSYESVDGTTFRATAVRDVNCSGVLRTYVLEGSSLNGTPSVSITSPPP